MKLLAVCLSCCLYLPSGAQDTFFLRVHFLYGSRPLPRYKTTEPKWFGGLLGGHVGIEADSDRVLNFQPAGSFHWFAHKRDKHGHYEVNTVRAFDAVMDGRPDSVKKLIIRIPITALQKATFDSLTLAYTRQSPYDYALLGMRCAAAAYDVLQQLTLVTHYSYGNTWRKILYPRKLRRRLLALAITNGWTITRQEGSHKRKWEKE